jgi:SDR family mycofactocin-dependent oxidoreductase
MGTLEGHVALITGAARGQGRSHALALAAEGADLVLCDLAEDIATVPYPLASKSELEATASAVESVGRRCLATVADVRDTAALNAVVNAGIDEFGHVDICIANAGVCGFGAFSEITDEMWADMIDVDLTGVFKTMRAVLPHMLERGYGRIIATSSMGGRAGMPNLAHYAAAKWGVIGLVKSLALEVADRGVTVNALCPTTVDTEMVHNPALYGLFCPDLKNPTRDEVTPRYAAMNPAGRPWMSAEEVSRVALFLCSDAASAMTGEAVHVSLGGSASMP